MSEERCYNKTTGHLLIKQLGLHESAWGDQKGSQKQYRDSRKNNSTHAREFEDKICFHQDKHNPEINLVDHFLDDVLKPEAVLAGSLTFLGALAISKNWKSALFLSLGMGAFVQLLVDN